MGNGEGLVGNTYRYMTGTLGTTVKMNTAFRVLQASDSNGSIKFTSPTTGGQIQYDSGYQADFVTAIPFIRLY
jgi:hypothetical protein